MNTLSNRMFEETTARNGHRWTARILLVSISALLAACGGFNGREQSLTPEQHHPITVDPQVASMTLPITSETVALSVHDKASVSAFVKGYKARGHGPITVSAPSGSPNESAAVAAVGELRVVLDSLGVAGESVAYTPYRASSAAKAAPIVLSFRQYVASAPACGNWTMNFAYNPRNVNSPNYGCASQSNLAAIVADPRDLIEPRDMAPIDAARRDIIVDKYRKGEATAAERTEFETLKVSEID